MTKRKWISTAEVLCILLLLMIVTNPELRVFLLIADAIGVELVLLMFVVQIKGWRPLIEVLAHRAYEMSARVVSRSLAMTAWTARCFVPNEGPWLAANAVLMLASSVAFAVIAAR